MVNIGDFRHRTFEQVTLGITPGSLGSSACRTPAPVSPAAPRPRGEGGAAHRAVGRGTRAGEAAGPPASASSRAGSWQEGGLGTVKPTATSRSGPLPSRPRSRRGREQETEPEQPCDPRVLSWAAQGREREPGVRLLRARAGSSPHRTQGRPWGRGGAYSGMFPPSAWWSAVSPGPSQSFARSLGLWEFLLGRKGCRFCEPVLSRAETRPRLLVIGS